MIKKTITYMNFDEEEVTKDFYFHVNEAELMELEVSVGVKGFMETVQDAIKAENMDIVLESFKRLIRLSIGERDGDLFNKTDEIRDNFMKTNAYSALFVELIQNAQLASEFVNGILPRKLAEQVANSKDQLALDMQAKIEEKKTPAKKAVKNTPELPEAPPAGE